MKTKTAKMTDPTKITEPEMNDISKMNAALVVPVRLNRMGSPSRIARRRKVLKESFAVYREARADWYSNADHEERGGKRGCNSFWGQSLASERRALVAVEAREQLNWCRRNLIAELAERDAYTAERARMVVSRMLGEA